MSFRTFKKYWINVRDPSAVQAFNAAAKDRDVLIIKLFSALSLEKGKPAFMSHEDYEELLGELKEFQEYLKLPEEN